MGGLIAVAVILLTTGENAVLDSEGSCDIVVVVVILPGEVIDIGSVGKDRRRSCRRYWKTVLVWIAE